MSGMRTVLNSTAAVASLAVGYVLWAVLSPGEKRIHRLKNLPESNPERMEESRQRNAMVMQVLKEAATTNSNIARGFDRPGK
ncbi:ubiquinol-cytochrome-c reductase complex assembly factor 3 [Kryptolebias marmoratus]|uniref:Ubiquinol-cytochrome-c reductase complex assembly factor 3 n=1 Tax=Kryptolebias marmoratus TaxID=37003 RepID=A0A3Q3APX0_KRYMA|nr:ubiquinol-cytochrome-c reductase complex assembly factor 3 [Kryptolebias marmoratus]